MSTDAILMERWTALAGPEARAAGEDLVRRYREPHRHYRVRRASEPHA
ncbi:hypothetical protein [Nocardia sp. CC227C]|nr:hypothetical protein [Nocardia sp. CC227C]